MAGWQDGHLDCKNSAALIPRGSVLVQLEEELADAGSAGKTVIKPWA